VISRDVFNVGNVAPSKTNVIMRIVLEQYFCLRKEFLQKRFMAHHFFEPPIMPHFCEPLIMPRTNDNNKSNMAPTKQKYKKRPKCNGDSTLNKAFACPNGICGKVFASKQGMSNHYLYYSQCHKVLTGSSAFWKQREEEANVAHEAPFTNANSDNKDDATQFNFDAEYPESDSDGTNVSQGLEIGLFTNIYAVAKQRGVQHTVSDFVERKLLKILEDANVPHFVDQDILNWGCNAKASGYKFEPERTTRKAVNAHIERRFNLDHC
jgi:hypothetical protein